MAHPLAMGKAIAPIGRVTYALSSGLQRMCELPQRQG
jgi:hypothetical protein